MRHPLTLFTNHGTTAWSPLAKFLRFTQATAADRDAVQAMCDRLSRDTCQRRHMICTVPVDEAHRVCGVTEDRGISLLARLPAPDERVIGCAYCIYTDPRDRAQAEAAIVVEDSFQGVGIGSALFNQLLAAAEARGVRFMALDTLADNQVAIRLFRASGRPQWQINAGDMAHITVALNDSSPLKGHSNKP